MCKYIFCTYPDSPTDAPSTPPPPQASVGLLGSDDFSKPTQVLATATTAARPLNPQTPCHQYNRANPANHSHEDGSRRTRISILHPP